MDELALLADTAGAAVVERFVQNRVKPDPGTFIGRGKVQQIAADNERFDLIIFDDDLTPAQANELEKQIGKRVIDRSGLILDIFARRAKTREARTQVELAQLQYLLPRLTGKWRHLERQAGGIGLRGPGETQLETDRRLIRTRISKLRKDLTQIEKQRDTQRQNRERAFKVAIVGYTNAGKSTLLNALTNSHVFVEDRLFATLDATVRSLKGPDAGQIVLIDTVGFIRKLPHHLVASFRSTLEETVRADHLLHVVDCSHPHFPEQMKQVEQTLQEMGLKDNPTTLVFNKADRVESAALIERIKLDYPQAEIISALRGIRVDRLKQQLHSLCKSWQKAIKDAEAKARTEAKQY